MAIPASGTEPRVIEDIALDWTAVLPVDRLLLVQYVTLSQDTVKPLPDPCLTYIAFKWVSAPSSNMSMVPPFSLLKVKSNLVVSALFSISTAFFNLKYTDAEIAEPLFALFPVKLAPSTTKLDVWSKTHKAPPLLAVLFINVRLLNIALPHCLIWIAPPPLTNPLSGLPIDWATLFMNTEFSSKILVPVRGGWGSVDFTLLDWIYNAPASLEEEQFSNRQFRTV